MDKKTEEVKEEKKEEKKERYEVMQVATQHTELVIDHKNEDAMDLPKQIAKVLNNQEKLMKALL